MAYVGIGDYAKPDTLARERNYRDFFHPWDDAPTLGDSLQLLVVESLGYLIEPLVLDWLFRRNRWWRRWKLRGEFYGLASSN